MIHPYDDLPLHQSSAPLLHPTSDSLAFMTAISSTVLIGTARSSSLLPSGCTRIDR